MATLVTKNTATFQVNDILRMKDASSDEWLLVTADLGGGSYTVTRDLAGSYGAGANPTWKKGMCIANYGQNTGASGLYLTASDTNNSYLSIFSHTGTPYTSLTTQLRLGNLNGYLGYVADTFGFGAGSSSGTNSNITIDPTNGIRLRKGTTNSITLDNSGVITVGEVGAGLANTYISAGALDIRLNTTSVFGVDTSGNVRIGALATENVYITSTGVQLRDGTTVYTDLTAGALLLGQTGASQSNVYITSGALYLRNNVTNKIVLKADGTANFAGAITVGDGTTTSGSITLSHFATGGDTYISGGTITASAWTAQNGFIIGIDDSDSDKFKAYFGDSTTGYQWDWNVTAANVLTVNGSALTNNNIFGDGSDGDVTISGDTTITRDMYYNNLTINSTKTLNPGGYRIFVKNTLTNNGIISTNGNFGEDGAAAAPANPPGGAALSAAYLGASGAGGTGGGGAPSTGAAGGSLTSSLGAAGGAGGNAANAGGAGGTVTPPPSTSGSFSVLPMTTILYDYIVGLRITGGAGGGGGGRDGGADEGGGGGSGALVMLIVTRFLVNEGVISANGGAGGDGYGVAAGGGGGGGANIYLIYSKKTGAGTITANGGVKGTGAGGRPDGTDGSAASIIELVV